MDPLLKLVVDIQNSEKMKELTNYVNQQDAAVRALNADLKAGTINQQQFTAAAMPLAANIRGANAQLHELQSVSQTAGRGLGQLAYAIDDIQYGFNAIVNNIPQIVMGLGGGMGLAGALGIAAVAVNQLIKHWSEWTAAFQNNWSGGGVEQLKMIAERAEKAADAWKSLSEAKSKWDEKGAAGIKEAIVEGGSDAFAKAVADTMMATGQGAKGGPGGFGSFLRGSISASVLMSMLPKSMQPPTAQQATLDQAQKLIAQTQLGGEAGASARLRLQGLMNANPGAFTEEQRKAITANDPAKLKEKDRQDKLDKEDRELHKEEIQNQNELVQHRVKAAEKAAKENAEEQKRAVLAELDMKRTAVMDEKARINELYPHGRSGQILQGAKAALDMYQNSTNSNEAERMKLLKAADMKLKAIADAVQAERAIRPRQ